MIARTIVALGALSILGFTAVPASAKDERVRLRCEAEGAADISMSAKWERRGSGSGARKKFSVEFEAAPNVGFSEGDKIIVAVKDVTVGSVALESVVGGDLVADLNYDTNPTEEDADPFPSSFPKDIGRGTKVQVLRGDSRLLGCKLR
jgi:hypothetical protein